MVMQPQKSNPPVGDVVEAWVMNGWYWVYWDGAGWRFYPTHEVIEAPILRWRYVPMGA
jgi:hypothetical protein